MESCRVGVGNQPGSPSALKDQLLFSPALGNSTVVELPRRLVMACSARSEMAAIMTSAEEDVAGDRISVGGGMPWYALSSLSSVAAIVTAVNS